MMPGAWTIMKRGDDRYRIAARLLRIATVAALPLAAAACTTTSAEQPVAVVMPAPMVQPVVAEPQPVQVAAVAEPEVQTARSEYEVMYGAVTDGKNFIPALDVNKIAERNLRKQVDYATDHPVGTIIVDPYARYLYLVQPGGKIGRAHV